MYASRLPDLIRRNLGDQNLTIWTSTMKRTIQTASLLPHPNKKQWKALEELDAGVCDGMTYEEIAVSVTSYLRPAGVSPFLDLSMRPNAFHSTGKISRGLRQPR